jgi:hypothetical protein
MISRIYLALVGTMYLGLSAWCTISPQVTSQKVGFDIQPGSGQSEFLVIYGGLELGLALILLMPLVYHESLRFSLLSCILIHGCLVAFRTASFFMFTEFESMTYNLAIGEWTILLFGLVCFFFAKPANRPT